jgi:hypothetical protein
MERRLLFSSVTFASPVSYHVGGSVFDVATADLRGDGIQDIVTANYNGTVSVLLGKGNGTFHDAKTYSDQLGSYSSGGGEEDLVVTDLGNGHPDILVANQYSGNVSVLLGNGNGTFQSATLIQASTTGQVEHFAVADLGNGHPDLVTTNYSGTVSVLLGNSSGSFTLSQSIAVGGDLESISLADINGDSNLDIVLANDSTGTVEALYGNGQGSFAGVQTITAAGADVRKMEVADFNGNPDILIFNQDKTVDLALGNGAGTFQTAQVFTSSNGGAVGDFTGDGILDLALGKGSQAYLLVGNGIGSFEAAKKEFILPNGENGSAVGDLTGDGEDDLVFGYSNATVGVRLDTTPPPTTKTTLAISPNPGTVGLVVTLTATVISTGGLPGGTVTFEQGATTLGTASVNTSTQVATFTTSSLAVGTDSIIAVYGGTDGFVPSTSAVIKETIVPVPLATTTTLASLPASPTFGQTVTLTASVTATSGSPSGTVVFQDGSTTLGTATINSTTHKATFKTTALLLGTNSLTAAYEGTKGFVAGTSSSDGITVAPATTATALKSSATSDPFGKAITLTATVTSPGDSPGGTVTFLDGATTLGTASVNTSTHVATLTTSNLTVGANSLTAVYGGTSSFISSTSSAVNVTVAADATTTKLASSPNPGTLGQVITLTATVTSTSGSPGGTVTFLQGSATLGTAPVNTATHIASITTSSLPAGTNSLTAAYGGTTGFNASTSSAFSETIKYRYPNMVGTLTGSFKTTSGPHKGATGSVTLIVADEDQTTGDFSGTITDSAGGDATIIGTITTSGAILADTTDVDDSGTGSITGTFANSVLTGKFTASNGDVSSITLRLG